MGKFNEYSQKATPADNDTMMIYDAAAKANKLSPFSGIWNWIVGKLTNAVISNLQTSNQTVLGAINELNNKPLMTESTDLNNASGGFTILHWKLQTANTPRTEGLTTASSGIVLSYIESANWAVQFGMIPANKNWYVRVKSSGEWSRWEEKSSNRFFATEQTISGIKVTKGSTVEKEFEFPAKAGYTRHYILSSITGTGSNTAVINAHFSVVSVYAPMMDSEVSVKVMCIYTKD